MVTVRDIRLRDGRNLRVHDSGGEPGGALFTVIWHHGSPQTGALLAPILDAALRRGFRLVSYGRPSYGGSADLPNRDVASAASDVEQLANALDVGRFATMGASGGAPHALACSALLADRVVSVASLAGLAPYGAANLDWFGGMAADGESLRAAANGREAREHYETTAEFAPDSFSALDYEVLERNWESLEHDVGQAAADGAAGLIDDDLAFVAPWGFDIGSVTAPTLLVHGEDDRVVPASHSKWLLSNLLNAPDRELWLRPNDGHIAILNTIPLAMDWLFTHQR